MTNEVEVVVGLGLDFQTQSYLGRIFHPFEETLDCGKISLSDISRELSPLAKIVGADKPAQDYNSRLENWQITNAGLRRLHSAGERFDQIVQQNPELRSDPSTKEMMITFITAANHLAHTNGKIASTIDDKETRKSLAEEGKAAIETAAFWAKDYGLILERNKSINDFVNFRRDNCLPLPPIEAIRELALLTMTISMMIDTNKTLGLPPNANHLNNLGVLYTDMAEIFFAHPDIKVRGIDFEGAIHNAVRAFRDADTQIEAIENKDSPDYKRKRIMVASNQAQVYLLSAEHVIASTNGPASSGLLIQQIRGFNQHYEVAAGVTHELSQKNPKEESEKRILDFFKSEIYCRGIRGLIVITQYAKQGFTLTEEFGIEKKRVLNLVSKFDEVPLERLEMSWKETFAYAHRLMSRFTPEDSDDRIAKQKVELLLEKVATTPLVV